MASKKSYGRDGTRVLLNTTAGPVVIAVATDAEWAKVLVDQLNKMSNLKVTA